jgi:hypothetical protein
MEFPRAFNEERRLEVRRLAVGLRAEARFGEEKAGALRVRPGQASSRTSICGKRAGATRWLLA